MQSILDEYQALVALTLQYLQQENPSLQCRKICSSQPEKDTAPNTTVRASAASSPITARPLKHINTELPTSKPSQKEETPLHSQANTSLHKQLLEERQDFAIKNSMQKKEGQDLSIQHSLTLPLPQENRLTTPFTLQAMPPAKVESFHSVKQQIRKHLPRMPLLEAIPDDALARQINSASEYTAQLPSVLFLSTTGSEKIQKLWQHLACAVNLHLAPARLLSSKNLEQNNDWHLLLKAPQVQLILACTDTLHQATKLKTYYRRDPKTGNAYLQEKALFLVEDLTIYLHNTHLKGILWDSLTEMIRPLL